MQWDITYYNSNIQKFMESLPEKLQGRLTAVFETMIENGPDIGMPHTRAMGSGLFEIRVQSHQAAVRIFYATVVRQEIIMLHAFIKKTQQTPRKELELARQRLAEVKKHVKRR